MPFSPLAKQPQPLACLTWTEALTPLQPPPWVCSWLPPSALVHLHAAFVISLLRTLPWQFWSCKPNPMEPCLPTNSRTCHCSCLLFSSHKSLHAGLVPKLLRFHLGQLFSQPLQWLAPSYETNLTSSGRPFLPPNHKSPSDLPSGN